MSEWYRPRVRQPIFIAGSDTDSFGLRPGMLLEVVGVDRHMVMSRIWIGPFCTDMMGSCVRELLDDRRVFTRVSPLELLALQAVE